MKITTCLILTMAALLLLGCSKASNENRNGAVNQPANSSATNANRTEATKAGSDNTAAGSLATPTETYKTAYAAREKKDLEGLKKVMSKRLLGFLSGMAEAEKKTVDDELKELVEKPQAKTAEARNEKITGDTATLEYLDEEGHWSSMDFVKEGGDWKMTLPPADTPANKETNKKP